ncbi:MAG: DUF4231 domain-containing protein [Cyanobacteriota bacterium]|nr:DUF4231 domain-containing protein [Cyanobacteriota bacterium]
MAKKSSYRQYLKTEFTGLIDTLELPDLEKRFLKSRWLDQLLWLEGKAAQAKKWSTRLRLMAIVGGVLIPALVSLNFNDTKFGRTIGWVTFGLSQIVAISVAVEEYFHFGAKYTQYRATAEYLKSEMWQFLQLSGSYQEYPTHAEGYSTFAWRVEKSIQQDVEKLMKLIDESVEGEKKLLSSLSQGKSLLPTLSAPPNKSNNAKESSPEAPLGIQQEPQKPTSGEGKTNAGRS